MACRIRIKFGKDSVLSHSAKSGERHMFAPSIDARKTGSNSWKGSGKRADLVDMCPPRPTRIMVTVSAVSARGTVEMLNAPERAKVSTDMPS